VRHPGYTGTVLYNLGAPILLGSYAAISVGITTLLVLVLRTAREENTLLGGLAGYSDYTKQVRFRLLPFVW